MKIVMTGGGSGGHITPILAVAHDIKEHHKDASVLYIGQKGDSFGEIVANEGGLDGAFTIHAGKFRRYHGQGVRQLLDIKTILLNLRDAFRTIAGFVQAYMILRRIKPDAIFCKGGFVGVPVGLAAAALHIPYVTHDSDAIPGLANRIIAKWAHTHAVALAAEEYPYEPSKTVSVGVPVSYQYTRIDQELQKKFRMQLGLDQFTHMLLITGGGLGSVTINDAMISIAPALLKAVPGLAIVHTVGKANETTMSESYTKVLEPTLRPRVIVRDYLQDLYRYSAAADVIVARGGATNFAEFALQAKPSIIIPNPYLTGGHQVKNALMYEKGKAAVVVTERDLQDDPTKLYEVIVGLMTDAQKRAKLSANIHTFARPNATHDLAELIWSAAHVAKKD